MSFKNPQRVKIFNELKDFHQNVGKFAADSGLISHGMLEKWNRQEYAVAFFRELGERASMGKGSPRRPDGSPIHTLKGSTKNIRDPLDSLVEGPMRLIQLAMENRVRQKLVRDVFDKPGGEAFGAKIPPKHLPRYVSREQLQQGLDDAYRKIGFEPGTKARPQTPEWLEVMQLWGNVRPHGENIMSVLKNGKPTYYEIRDPQLVSALGAFRRQPPTGLNRFLNFFRRLRQSAITIDPTFMFRNLSRDAPMSIISTKNGAMRYVVNAARGYWSAFARNKVYHEYVQNLGGGATHRDQGVRFQRQLIRRAQAEGLNPRSLLLRPTDVFRAIDALGRSVELGPRLTEFIGARQRGKTKGRAAFEGREITTDFAQFASREGQTIKFMQDSIPFFNAMSQSVDRVYRLAARDPEGKLGFAFKTALVPLYSIALYDINRRIQEYNDLSDFQKDLGWHYFIPKRLLPEDFVAWFEEQEPATQDSPYVHLIQPKFWEIGSLGSIAERTMAVMYGDEPDMAEDVFRLVRQNFGISFPVLLDETIAQVANRDLNSGFPIVPMYAKGHTPGLQASARQGPTIEAIGETAGVSPARAEHFLQSLIAAWASYGLESTDKIVQELKLVDDPRVAMHLDQTPVVRAFYARPGKSSRVVREYYALKEELAPKYYDFTRAVEIGRPEIAMRMAQDPEARMDLVAARSMARIDSAISRLGRTSRALRRGSIGPQLTPEQRRDQLHRIEQDRRAMMRQAMENVRAIREAGGTQ